MVHCVMIYFHDFSCCLTVSHDLSGGRLQLHFHFTKWRRQTAFPVVVRMSSKCLKVPSCRFPAVFLSVFLSLSQITAFLGFCSRFPRLPGYVARLCTQALSGYMARLCTQALWVRG